MGLFDTYNQSTPSPSSPLSSSSFHTSYGFTYEIMGNDLQVLELSLEPQKTVIAEAGAMVWMEEGITYEARLGDGSKTNESFMNKLFDAGKRFLTGESLFLTHFTNHAMNPSKVAFAAAYPGTIIPLNLQQTGTLLCQKDAFLCATHGVRLDMAFNRRLGAGFFGGEGFILEKISGQGDVFLHAGGTIVKKELRGEMLRVDTGCLVAFSEGIEYDITQAGNLKSMIFGGEGLFLATLKGHGSVWLQSLPFARLADRVLSHNSAFGGSRDEGSLLGGFSNIFER